MLESRPFLRLRNAFKIAQAKLASKAVGRESSGEEAGAMESRGAGPWMEKACPRGAGPWMEEACPDVAHEGAPGVIRVSAWRLREMRRKSARWRDKEAIKALNHEIGFLRQQLDEWACWYRAALWHRWKEDAQNQQQPRQQQQQRVANLDELKQDLEPKVSVIDYSKWDHIECDDEDDEKGQEEESAYSDDELDGYWDSYASEEAEEGKDHLMCTSEEEDEEEEAKEEEDPTGTDEEEDAEEENMYYDEEFEMQERADMFEDDEADCGSEAAEAVGEDGREREAKENFELQEGADMFEDDEADCGSEAAEAAGEDGREREAKENERKTMEEDDAMRKQRVMDALAGAEKELRSAFDHAAQSLDDLPDTGAISATLKKQQQQVSWQMASYAQSIAQMRDSEFSIDGTPKILQLIAMWCEELAPGIASLVPD